MNIKDNFPQIEVANSKKYIESNRVVLSNAIIDGVQRYWLNVDTDNVDEESVKSFIAQNPTCDFVLYAPNNKNSILFAVEKKEKR